MIAINKKCIADQKSSGVKRRSLEDDYDEYENYVDDDDDDDDDDPVHSAASDAVSSIAEPIRSEIIAKHGADSNKGDILYAIHKAADAAQRLDIAWKYLNLAHQKVRDSRKDTPFDRIYAIEAHNTTKKVITPSLMASFPDISDEASDVPIFIVGMMRSGSTLLETMLDSHPFIWGSGEDSVFNNNLTALRDRLANINSPLDTRSSGRGRMDKIREILLDYNQYTVSEMRRIARETSDAMQAKDFRQLRFIVDKMLFNYGNIPFIHLVFPESLIIHMVRDPLDTLFSCFKQKFDDVQLIWSTDANDLVLKYVLYLEIMQVFRALLPHRIMEVRYEALVDNPERELKKIFAAMRLKWDESVLKFYDNKRSVQTNSQSQVRQRLYSHSIGGWRKYESFLAPIKEEFLQFLPYLRSLGALPFAETMNWNMSADFPYDISPSKKTKSGQKNDL